MADKLPPRGRVENATKPKIKPKRMFSTPTDGRKRLPNNMPATGIPATGPGWGDQIKSGHGATASQRAAKALEVIYTVMTTSTFEGNRLRAAEALLDRDPQHAKVQRNLNHEITELDALDADGLARREAELEARIAKSERAQMASTVPEVPGGVVH